MWFMWFSPWTCIQRWPEGTWWRTILYQFSIINIR